MKNATLTERILLAAVALLVVGSLIAATPLKNILLQSNLDAGGYQITNLTSGNGTSNAATVGYVTNALGFYVPTSNGTATNLTLAGNSTVSNKLQFLTTIGLPFDELPTSFGANGILYWHNSLGRILRLSENAYVYSENGTATNLTVNGTTTFGNATQVRTALTLGTLATQNGTYGNATELTTGTVPAARLPSFTLNLSGTLHNTPVNFTAGVGNATLANQTAATFFAGPTSGNATTPTFRPLVNGDIPQSLAPTGNFTAGDAAGDEFVANDDDPRSPNLTSATYNAAADPTVLINGNVGDVRYGPVYILRLGADLTANSTSSVLSSESLTIPAGTYSVQYYVYGQTASATAGINISLTSSVSPTWISGVRLYHDIVAQGVTDFTTPSKWRTASSLTGLGSFADPGFKTSVGYGTAYFSIPSSTTMQFNISQRSASDGANPMTLQANSIFVFRRIQ